MKVLYIRSLFAISEIVRKQFLDVSRLSMWMPNWNNQETICQRCRLRPRCVHSDQFRYRYVATFVRRVAKAFSATITPNGIGVGVLDRITGCVFSVCWCVLFSKSEAIQFKINLPVCENQILHNSLLRVLLSSVYLLSIVSLLGPIDCSCN